MVCKLEVDLARAHIIFILEAFSRAKSSRRCRLISSFSHIAASNCEIRYDFFFTFNNISYYISGQELARSLANINNRRSRRFHGKFKGKKKSAANGNDGHKLISNHIFHNAQTISWPVVRPSSLVRNFIISIQS